jgi:hypothetical protein
VFEIHAGGSPSATPSKVKTSQLPTPGPAFPTFAGDPSRRVPSWYFGDGAALANQVVAQTGDAGHIVPLDSVLVSPSAVRGSGGMFGFRIGHTVTRRVLVALSYDRANGQVSLTSGALASIAATNASFQPYWTALLTRPGTANVTSSSTMAVTGNDVSSADDLLSLGVEVRVTTYRGWTPYVAIGGGLLIPEASGPTVTLAGTYQFNLVNPGAANNGVLVRETDQLRVQFQTQPAPIGILGFGVEHDLMRHLGVRAEGRWFLQADSLRIRVDTFPQPALPQGPQSAVIRRGTNPSLQVSSNPAAPTSLSLQGVNRFFSFEGTGNLPSFSAGLFFRF